MSSIICTQLKKFDFTGNVLKVHFFYPKLIILENPQSVRIIDFRENIEKEITKDDLLNSEIVDNALQDNFLWLVLKSGVVVVVNVLDGSRINIVNSKSASYNIHQIKCHGSNLVLMSESQEYFTAPYTSKELIMKLEEGIKEVAVCYEKVYKLNKEGLNIKKFINSLEANVDKNTLYVRCPITDLSEILSKNVDHFICWNDLVILTKVSIKNMWIIDVKESEIIHDFKNVGSNYYPLGVQNDCFYYILWNSVEVCICYATNTTNSNTGHINSFALTEFQQRPERQDILKNQLNDLMKTVLSSPETVQVLPDMQPLFDKIDDFDYLINVCVKLCLHNTHYKSIVYYFQKKVFTYKNKIYDNIVNDIIIKVDLIEYIKFTKNNNYDGVNFFEKNLKELCIIFLSNSDLDIACICWLKFSGSEDTINSDDIVAIMHAIPHNVKLGILVVWLRNFVPPLLNKNPYYIDLFVRWTTDRIFNLERSNYWPKIGLKFVEEITSVLEKSMETIVIRPISMNDLDLLKDRLCYILELKEKYKINMLFTELGSQNANETALIMLRRCYTEDLEEFLRDYLPSYAARHSLNLDDTLRLYVESDAATSGGDVDGSRLQIILNSFNSPTCKLECLLQVLKLLDVPWSKNIVEIAVAAAASVSKEFTVTDAEQILSEDILRELNFSKVKVMLKKYNFPLTFTDYILVIHKIINAPNISLSDLELVTSVITGYENYGSVLYIVKCLKNCETKLALDYFKGLPKKNQIILLKTLISKYEQRISGNVDNANIEKNYLDFLKGTHLLNSVQTENLENLYHLKNSYNVRMNTNILYSERKCVDETKTCVASSGKCGIITRLIHTYQSQESTMVDLLKRTSTSHKERQLVETLLMNQSEDPSSQETITSALSIFKDGHNSSLLINTFNVMVELVTNCNENHIHYLLQSLSILNVLKNINIVVKNLAIAWKFRYIYLPMSSNFAVNALLTFNAKKPCIANFEYLYGNNYNNNDFVPLRLIANVLESNLLTANEVSNNIIDTREKVVTRFLSKVAISQDLDEVLLTSLLLILNSNKEVDNKMWLLELLQNHNESPSISCYISNPLIHQIFAFDNVMFGSPNMYTPQYILKSKFNLNLADTDLTEEMLDAKVVLFYVLKQYPNTTFDRLSEICRTLGVSVNDGLSLQLISLISTWELNYKVFNDSLGCRQIHYENDEKGLISKCLMIWDSISDKKFLLDILNDFWKRGEVTIHDRLVSINPYFFEAYLCIHRLIFSTSEELKSTKEYFLLHFLKDYIRKSPPKQYEVELFSVKGLFPEIGHYRLPFHLFMRDDMWSTLKSEITLDTYERWLPAVTLLSLDAVTQVARDMICSNALKQTMTTRKRKDDDVEVKEAETWNLTSREESLLRAAHKCVKNISNMEWAGACLFYVLQGCARGADQVAAAQLCYQFAQRWAAYQPDNRAVGQMERLHSTLSTRHALYKIDWACEELVRLSTEPVQLIRALYSHPNLVEKINRFDVNQVADEIADKNGINISLIRIQILEDLLQKANEDPKNQNVFGLETKELITAKYILKATCPKMGAIYLSRIAFDDESDFNNLKKLRALQCLMSVVDTDSAKKVTNHDRNHLWLILLELLDIVGLENIDMPWIVSTLIQDKYNALEQLMQSVDSNIKGLKIAASLAYRYGDLQIIHNLIPLLLKADLLEDVIPLLLSASTAPDNTVYAGWRAVILSPFQRADYPITDRQKARCLKVINLLPVCPIIKDEYLIEIWRNCVRCKCFGLGCLVLPYMTTQTRQTLKELKVIDKRNLIVNLKNLHSETYLVSSAMHVIDNLISKPYR